MWLLGFLSKSYKQETWESKSERSCKPFKTSLGSHITWLLLHSFCCESLKSNPHTTGGKSDCVSQRKSYSVWKTCEMGYIGIAIFGKYKLPHLYHMFISTVAFSKVCFNHLFFPVSSLLYYKLFENKDNIFIIFMYSDIGRGLNDRPLFPLHWSLSWFFFTGWIPEF